MMRKLLCMMAFLALLAAPTALAQEDYTTANDVEEGEQAWVDECPPDHMCAMDAPAEEEEAPVTDGNEMSGDEPPYSGDCGGEVCAYDGNGTSRMGPDDCIDCMQPPSDEGSHCMDGADANETCRDDVQYMTPPEEHDPDQDYVQAPEGSEGGITSVEDGAAEQTPQNAVPAPALAVGLVAIAGAAALFGIARRA